MQTLRQIWSNPNLRTGGFYDLSIEVSGNEDVRPVQDLIRHLFQLDFVKGPFNADFEAVALDLEYFENLGYIEVEGLQVPFQTFAILETGFGGCHWLDISVYAGIYEAVLGEEYQVCSEHGKRHQGFDDRLIEILKHLNAFYPIRTAAIDLEVSAMYCLQHLKDIELSPREISWTTFFVNQGEYLKGVNQQAVHQL